MIDRVRARVRLGFLWTLFLVAGFWIGVGWTASELCAQSCDVQWTPLGDGVDGSVHALIEFDDGSGPSLYAGGHFDAAGGVASPNIVRWDGSAWSEVGAGTDDEVFALAVFDDGNGAALYTGGRFQAAGGIDAYGIARWDGASWTPVGDLGLFFTTTLGVRGPGTVDALGVYDGALYASGMFTDADGEPTMHIARWDGAAWSSLGTTLRGLQIHSFATFDDGGGNDLYLAGSFSIIGGVPARNIARWDGSGFSTVGSNDLLGFVFSLHTHDDDAGPALYAGGLIGSAGGSPVGRIAKWDGASWSPLGAGVNGNVFALASFDDGGGEALYAGGLFTEAGGSPAGRIARWDGAAWSTLDGGVGPGEPRALGVFDRGGAPGLFVGGTFTEAGGDPASHVARWGPAEMTLSVSPLIAGQPATLETTCATPGRRVYHIASTRGRGSIHVPQLDITIDIRNPKLIGTPTADGDGRTSITVPIPARVQGRTIWLQAVEHGRKTPVVETVVQ